MCINGLVLSYFPSRMFFCVYFLISSRILFIVTVYCMCDKLYSLYRPDVSHEDNDNDGNTEKAGSYTCEGVC